MKHFLWRNVALVVTVIIMIVLTVISSRKTLDVSAQGTPTLSTYAPPALTSKVGDTAATLWTTPIATHSCLHAKSTRRRVDNIERN